MKGSTEEAICIPAPEALIDSLFKLYGATYCVLCHIEYRSAGLANSSSCRCVARRLHVSWQRQQWVQHTPKAHRRPPSALFFQYCNFISCSPDIPNLRYLSHPHGLEEAHVVLWLGPDQLAEVEDFFLTFSADSWTDWTPLEVSKTKALGGEEDQTTAFLNGDKENHSSLRSLG